MGPAKSLIMRFGDKYVFVNSDNSKHKWTTIFLFLYAWRWGKGWGGCLLLSLRTRLLICLFWNGITCFCINDGLSCQLCCVAGKTQVICLITPIKYVYLFIGGLITQWHVNIMRLWIFLVIVYLVINLYCQFYMEVDMCLAVKRLQKILFWKAKIVF